MVFQDELSRYAYRPLWFMSVCYKDGQGVRQPQKKLNSLQRVLRALALAEPPTPSLPPPHCKAHRCIGGAEDAIACL